VKLLVDGNALAKGPGRLRAALTGLASRGHDVIWFGAGAPATEGVRPLSSPGVLHADRPDLVVSAGRPAAAAMLVWRAGARGLLLELAPDDLAGWSLLDSLGWGASRRFGLLETSHSARARTLAGADVLPDIALWPEGPTAGEGDPVHPDTAFLELAGERLLAAARGPRPCPAVFLDRDGTLIVERGYLSDPGGVELLPGVPAALRLMHDAGAAIVVISNQAGIGRGLFTLEQAWATMARLRRLLRNEGVELDGIRFCPHRPEEGCHCRKPSPGMLEEASETLHLSPAGSVMAGDRWLDAAAGRSAGGMGVLLRTGYGREEEARIAAGVVPAPDRVLDDMRALASWVVDRLEAM
jgi:D-glycero-D-manno-heptose 1,7-bisphosphate phosphatase